MENQLPQSKGAPLSIAVISASQIVEEVLRQGQPQARILTFPSLEEAEASAMLVLDIPSGFSKNDFLCWQERLKSALRPLLLVMPEGAAHWPPLQPLEWRIRKPCKAEALLKVTAEALHAAGRVQDEAPLIWGDFHFFPFAKRLVYRPESAIQSRRIDLTEKEGEIMRCLYASEGRTVSRETLLSGIWGYNPWIDTHTLETHVYRLRQKIAAQCGGVELIATGSEGYRLCPSPFSG